VSYTYTAGGLINSTTAGVGAGADRVPTAIHRYEFLPDGSVQQFVPGNLVGANPATGPRVYPGGSYGTHQISNGGSGWDAVVDRGGSLVPETERGSMFAHYAFDLTDATTLYTQVVAGSNEVNSVGTLPLGIAGWAGTAYSGNPYLPANIQQLMTTNNIPSFLLERYHTTADLDLRLTTTQVADVRGIRAGSGLFERLDARRRAARHNRIASRRSTAPQRPSARGDGRRAASAHTSGPARFDPATACPSICSASAARRRRRRLRC
jgi:hypothetical protein